MIERNNSSMISMYVSIELDKNSSSLTYIQFIQWPILYKSQWPIIHKSIEPYINDSQWPIYGKGYGAWT